MAKKKHKFLVSDESINSHGFKILTAGIKTERFMKNPVMLSQHENSIGALIGRWENLQVVNNQLYAEPVFDLSDPTAKEIARKVDDGFLKGTSLGITYNRDNLTMENGELVLKECEIYEISIVAIGSNGNALRLLADDNKTLSLNLSLVKNHTSIETTLGLELNSTPEAMLNAIIELKAQAETYKAKIDMTKLAQKDDAERWTDFWIKKGKIPEHLRQVQLDAFDKDYYGALEEMNLLLPVQRFNFHLFLEQEKARKEQIANHSKYVSSLNQGGEDKTGGKDKSEWNLEDYRKLAPEELEENPSLFERLVNEKYTIGHTERLFGSI